ncbi:MAG TPA: GH25 family lysozyme [Anaerolineales bacterium]|nr:GH25 family lysozyme [Anaerolineales bacterium]
MATVPGIDVSYWNAGIDWPKVRATGQRYVFIKATESTSYKDPTFDDNWLGAKSAGLLRGAYHFFRCNADPKKQADNFIEYVNSLDDTGELPPVLDIETHDGQKRDKIVPAAKAWLDRVEAEFDKKPIIYSGKFFLQDYFSEVGGGPPAWAKDHPLWLAQYPDQYIPGMQPFLPRGWFKWAFWQYSDKGRINGINASVDLNVFNGTLEELYQLAGAQPVTETSATPKKHTVLAGDSFESIAIKYGVTVRELVTANPQLLKAGERLTIPVAVAIPSEDASPSTQRTHTVKAGETLTTIAIKYATTVAAIASANNITNINKISVGQVLIIP